MNDDASQLTVRRDGENIQVVNDSDGQLLLDQPLASTQSLTVVGRNLAADQLTLLKFACEHHEKGRVSDNPTVGCCWDADRLDLGRVGITPHPSRLCTNIAKLPKTIKWADRRAVRDYVPSFVKDDWGIESSV